MCLSNPSYLHKPVSKINSVAKIVRPSKVTVKGKGIKLCHYKYLFNPTVDAITHGDINQSVTSSNRNLHLM